MSFFTFFLHEHNDTQVAAVLISKLCSRKRFYLCNFHSLRFHRGDRVARRGFQGMAGFSELPELPEFPKRVFTARQVSQKIQNFQKGFHGMAGLNSLFTGKMHNVQKCFTRKEL